MLECKGNQIRYGFHQTISEFKNIFQIIMQIQTLIRGWSVNKFELVIPIRHPPIGHEYKKVDSGTPEGLAVLVPLMKVVVLLL